ncbi:MAG: thioredoxin [Phycisphaeraceae bacterium]|nr:MAG: thioredoxin [Phycisphaeraceae bacterium]
MAKTGPRSEPQVRRSRAVVIVLLASLTILALTVRFLYPGNTVFVSKTPEEARRSAVEQDRYLVMMATASWCGPCRKMRRTTWRDDQVVQWIEDNAIAVLLDVDRWKTLASELSIESMPTTIILHQDQELTRLRGYLTANQLMYVLNMITEGQPLPNFDTRQGMATLRLIELERQAENSSDIDLLSDLIFTYSKADKAGDAIAAFDRIVSMLIERRYPEDADLARSAFPIGALPRIIPSSLPSVIAMREKIELAILDADEPDIHLFTLHSRLNSQLGDRDCSTNLLAEIDRHFPNWTQAEHIQRFLETLIEYHTFDPILRSYDEWDLAAPVIVEAVVRSHNRSTKRFSSRYDTKEMIEERADAFHRIAAEQIAAAAMAAIRDDRPEIALQLNDDAINIFGPSIIPHAIVNRALNSDIIHPILRDIQSRDPVRDSDLESRLNNLLADMPSSRR